MARITKQKWHKIAITQGGKDLILVGSGKSSYLWVGNLFGCYGTWSGRKTLLSLADAIKRELS